MRRLLFILLFVPGLAFGQTRLLSGSALAPVFSWSTFFENTSRFITGTANGGSISASNTGLSLVTGATGGGYSRLAADATNELFNLFSGSSSFTIIISPVTLGTDLTFFCGVGYAAVAAGGITYGYDNYGFEISKVSGTQTFSSLTAHGGTVTRTTLTNLSTSHDYTLTAVKEGKTDVKFYVNGALVATHTTNLPVSNLGGYTLGYLAITNNNVAVTSTIDATLMSVSQSISY